MTSPEKTAALEAYVKTWLRLIRRNAADLRLSDSSTEGTSDAPGDEEEPTWAALPDVLLVEVLSYLQGTDRANASCVCRHWYDAFFAPRLWEHFVVGERSFVVRRQTLYRGYQYELSGAHVNMCLLKVGEYFRTLEIKPLSDYYNLYELFHVLNKFIEFYEDTYPLPHLSKFLFSFACETRSVAGTFVHGTGGKILTELRRLLGNLKGLKTLQLNQLLLDVKDAHGLLDSVVSNCSETLQELEILNCTREQYPYFHVALCNNMRRLVISPQQLSQDVVAMLPSTCLTDLVIVQDTFTEHATPVSGDTWREVRRLAPHLKVRLEVRDKCKMEIIFQKHAPVHQVVYKSPFSKVDPQALFTIVDHYPGTLRVYAYLGLPRFHLTRSFNSRCDTGLVMLIRRCQNLHTLVIRELISTCTLIIIAKESVGIQKLYVRKNAIIKRFDWPKNPDWSSEFFDSLKINSRTFEDTETEVSRHLGFPWRPLSDKEFKRIDI